MGVTSKTRAVAPKVFALDLNCAIYHCVKKVTIPYSEDTHHQWEHELIQSVLGYIRQLYRTVKPTEKLYVAVDGVAPMAKIRQQRMRRFKSAVQAVEEARIRAEVRGIPYVPTPRWDTNSITPGTSFMAKLTRELRVYASTNPHTIVVSPADEPGEGEQKIMNYVRTHKQSDVVVYGLDADLIVLALWNGAVESIQIDLFREETEFNGMVKQNTLGEEQYLYLDTKRLGEALYSEYVRPNQSMKEFLTDFVGLVNILGNDFIPHGMSLKIRDEGIEKMLSMYKTITPKLLLCDHGVWKYNPAALHELFTMLAEKEATWILKGVRSKLQSRVGGGPKRSPEEQALGSLNDKPVEWAVERCLVDRVQEQDSEKPTLRLKQDWESIYDREALWGADVEQVTRVYLESLAWTLAYYSGQPVDTHWYYPWPLPPRFRSLATSSLASMKCPDTPRKPLQSLEQLAMVLPQSSFSLLPKEYVALPRMYPFAWPVSWSLYSFGRRFLWECEPQIPLIQPTQIKLWIERLYE